MSLLAKFRHLPNLPRALWQLQRVANASSLPTPLEYERDPKPLFVDPETQQLLRSMTQCQISKVYGKVSGENKEVEHKFMTTEQLEEEFKLTVSRALEKLQMPPVVRVKEDKQALISEDKALKDFSDTKYVITDITYGLSQSERKVVVRETDGTLRYAPLEVAKRMNQIYFPMPGRKLRTPRMFSEEENFKRCLDEHKYEFILDRLTVQYEPNELDYHRFTSMVYEHLNESKQFDLLRSTRHFGPMAFYYAWHNCIDDLLYDMIQRDYLRNGVELIALRYKIHQTPEEYSSLLEQLQELLAHHNPALEELRKSLPRSVSNDIHEEITAAIGKTKADFEADDLCAAFIDKYIEKHALKKVQLELAMQSFKEIAAEKKLLYEGLNKAHGVQQRQ